MAPLMGTVRELEVSAGGGSEQLVDCLIVHCHRMDELTKIEIPTTIRLFLDCSEYTPNRHDIRAPWTKSPL